MSRLEFPERRRGSNNQVDSGSGRSVGRRGCAFAFEAGRTSILYTVNVVADGVCVYLRFGTVNRFGISIRAVFVRVEQSG